MTQNKEQKLDKLLESLHEHVPSPDLKDRIIARAMETPQAKPFWPLEKITYWLEGLVSPFPHDMGLKTASLACLAMACFFSGFMTYTPEAILGEDEIIASLYTTDLDEMEIY